MPNTVLMRLKSFHGLDLVIIQAKVEASALSTLKF